MKTKCIIVLLAMFASNIAVAQLRTINEHWSIWTYLSSGREVVQWNYVHDSDVNVVIEFREVMSGTNEWLIPISGNDGPTSSVGWSPKFPSLFARCRSLTAAELADLDYTRAYYQYLVENDGGNIIDYVITPSGELKKFPGLTTLTSSKQHKQ